MSIREEINQKHNLKFKDSLEEMLFYTAIDKLYLEFTKEQVIEIISDIYDHSDDIYNEINSQLEEGIQKLISLFGKEPENEDEDIPDDKIYKA